MTNIELINAILAQTTSPTLKTAMSYDEETGMINLEGGVPSLAEKLTAAEMNEFATQLINLVATQRVFGTIEGWRNDFSIFYRPSIRFGDIEQLLAVDVVNAEDYDGENPQKLLENVKPPIDVAYISTTDRKLWRVSISLQIMRGAFLNEYGLEDLVSKIIGTLEKSKNFYVYENALKDFTKITKTTNVQAISGVGDATNARKAYEQILKQVFDFAIPSRKYNEKGVLSTTNIGESVLILNTSYRASFDVNVFASLFNSGEIKDNKYFYRVLTANFEEPNTIGYIMDRDAYLVVNRIEEVTNFYNPYTMTTTYFYHNWLKRALNPLVNAVKLVGVSE